MIRWFVIGAVLGAAAGGLTDAACAAEPDHRPGLEFFEQRVRPILVQHCQECHGAKKQEAGLRLDGMSAALRGGDDGPAVTPGKPEDSLLIDAVKYQSREMPPDGKLPDEQIAALEQWIRMGAPWPAEAGAAEPALGDQPRIFAEAKTHWAFQPLHKPKPPNVRQQDWVRTPVDSFILARLEQARLPPTPSADRRTLIRRLTMDLIGLPPTAEEVEAYVNDHSPRAYADLVDRLLASPHYGERWGRHWLDVARYADTRDWVAQADLRYPFAYTYRDWVIQAINADLPLDAFIRQQLAADQYTTDPHSPNLAALGFLTVGPRFRNNTQDQVADHIDVVTRGLQGLTVACARCHDHKYDPIPTADYYSLYGVFASCEIPKQLPLIGESTVPANVRRDYEQKLAAAKATFDAYKAKLQVAATAELHQRIADYLQGWYTMSVTGSESVRSVISKYRLKETAMTPLDDSLNRCRKSSAGRTDPILAPLVLLVGLPDDKLVVKRDFLLAQAASRSKQALKLNAAVVDALKKSKPGTAQAVVKMYADLLTQAEKSWQQDPRKQDGLEAIHELLYRPDGPFALEAEAVSNAARLFGTARAEQFKLQEAVQDVESLHPGAPARAMVLEDKPEPIAPVIFLRGDSRRRGDPVPRRFLEILAGKNAPTFTHGSGRRDLAEDIVDPKNPLTARVMVNRVWMHHFGKPLVSSPGDFGLRTPEPLQHDLLDWLAATLVEQEWSLKKLHRTIVFSNTYRQASEPPKTVAAGDRDPQVVDPENQYYWRGNRRRLDFEAMRDAILVASGQLDPTLGGRPVKLNEVPFTTRRTVYGYVDRANLDDVFATFDFPSPDQSNPQRSETMVPQQALFAMNDRFIVEQARRLAALPEVAGPAQPADKIKALYRRVYAREPRPREVTLAEQFLAASDAMRQSQGMGGRWQYGYGTADARATSEDRFHPLDFWTGKEYQAGEKYPHPQYSFVKLTRNGGHPGKNHEMAVVRRWVAPREMTISIRGKLAHLSDRGDGVCGQILSGLGDVLGQWTAKNQSVDTPVKEHLVKRGETVDFVVDCRQTAISDGFNWSATIEVVQAQPGSMPGDSQWDSREDFAAPPPAPLSAWEQLAQALMLTNEFMFFD